MPQASSLVNRGVTLLAEAHALLCGVPDSYSRRRVALGAHQRHRGHCHRAGLLQDPPFRIGALASLLHVSFDQAQPLDRASIRRSIDLENLPPLARLALL